MMHQTETTFKRIQPNRLAVAVSMVICSLGITPVHAQETNPQESGLVLEEVIVTSQKRQESLQEVPISVVAETGEKLDKMGVETVEDLTQVFPSIHLTETGISTQLRVRGIGSGNSQGFEQSVGMYVDGVYYGRAQLFRAPMMDLGRVELLRGPQSTLFGKNSVAGALNITTARPSDELEGRISVMYEPEFNQREINAAISGPISDSLRGRLALRQYREDGYVRNSWTNEDEEQRVESAIRASLSWDATDRLDFFFKAERDVFDQDGRTNEITYDENESGATFSDTLRFANQPGLDGAHNYVRQVNEDEFSNNSITNFTLTGNYDLDWGNIVFTTGSLRFDYDEKCDCDFTAAEILELDLSEDYEQISQEIRFESEVGGTVEWLAGLYYQEYDQTFGDGLSIRENSVLPLIEAPLSAIVNTTAVRDFEQSSDTWSVFAQATWNIIDSLRFTFGGRFTEETKEARKVITIVDSSTGEVSTDPVTAVTHGRTYLGAFQLENEQAQGPDLAYAGHNVRGERDESEFTPLLRLEWDVSGDIMTYASYTEGFKAGGFDPRSNSVGIFTQSVEGAPVSDPNPSLNFEFEDEQVTAWELGMKTSFAGGRAELNAALFKTEYDNLQISQFDGGVGFNVGNAKETEVFGAELDGRFLLTESLTAGFKTSWIDFEYKDFTNGNCYFGATPVEGTALCDYTGKTGAFTPKYTVNTFLDYVVSLNLDWEFAANLDIQQVDGHQVHDSLDPAGEIDSYTMLDLRLALESEQWTFAILGKNLMDEKVISYSSYAPLSNSESIGSRTFYSFVRRPRTVAMQASFKF